MGVTPFPPAWRDRVRRCVCRRERPELWCLLCARRLSAEQERLGRGRRVEKLGSVFLGAAGGEAGAYLAQEPRGAVEATDHHPQWPQDIHLGDYFL